MEIWSLSQTSRSQKTYHSRNVGLHIFFFCGDRSDRWCKIKEATCTLPARLPPSWSTSGFLGDEINGHTNIVVLIKEQRYKILWGLCRQKQASRVGISNYIRSLPRDVITYPCLRYLHLATKSSYIHNKLDELRISASYLTTSWGICKIALVYNVVCNFEK